jgi:hypothetical protein
MAYDTFPMQTTERKKQFLNDAVHHKWIVAWGHDPDVSWSRLQKNDADHIVAVGI